ncbi:MAG: phosphoribosylanthranilate isomerase [Cyanobacteria bacterium P01_F01_bin.150]
MRVKICGITQPEQGMAIAQLGATALGFICVSSSPRYVTPHQIQRITKPLLEQPSTKLNKFLTPVDRVGVFANADLNIIHRTVKVGLLNVVQLHGNESLEFCQQVKAALSTTEVIKAFRIRDQDALVQTYDYATAVDTILLDAYHPTILGGTGHTLDWSILQAFKPSCPWFLAGGLNPGNVADAIAQVHPDGIDLSSGVEDSPGNKNLEKVKHLFQQIQA